MTVRQDSGVIAPPEEELVSQGPQDRLGAADDRRGARDGEARRRAAETPARDSTSAQDVESTVPFTQKLGRVAVVVIAALFLIFAIGNAQFVDFSWIFGGTEVVEQAGERVSGGVPLIVLLLVAFVAGAAVGGITLRQRRRHRQRDQKAR